MEITMAEELGLENENENPNPREIVETCPHCEAEVVIPWDVERQGYVATCPECGKSMFLCDECLHADDNETRMCDWHVEGNANCLRHVCFRGSYTI